MHLDIDVLHGLVPYDQHLADQIIAIVISILLRELPKPTIIVLSGRGLTWIYRYDHLILNPTTQEIRGKRKIVSHLNPDVFTHDCVYKMLIQKVQSLFDPAIIEVDSRITDHARILRMPGTINRKAGRYATIFDCDPACRYAPEQLYEYFNISPAYTVHDDVVITEPKKSTVKKNAASKSSSTSHERNTENDNIVLYPTCFESGQLYTALSRVKNINDLTLTAPIPATSLRVDVAILEFYQKIKTTQIAV